MVTPSSGASDADFSKALGVSADFLAGIAASTKKPLGIWPEHHQAVQIFADMTTQWRTGMNGATGLDYAALPMVMEMNDIPAAQRRRLFNEVRLMENEALIAFNERHQSARNGKRHAR